MAVPRYAVFGHPVAHSRSPAIHAAFAAQAGIALTYERIDAAPEAFADAVASFAAAGGRGANVTLPHKGAAFALCSTLSERARRAGAVNTLLRLDGEADGATRWHGDNTDGIGLVRDLRERHGLRLDGARVLLLGAGGAGAGVAPALLDAGVARLSIANRHPVRALALVAHLADPRADVAAIASGSAASSTSTSTSTGTSTSAQVPIPPADAMPAGVASGPAADGRFDVVINATSAARSGAAPWAHLADAFDGAAAAVDLGYGEAAAAFLDFARARGVSRAIDGLGMLVEQAAESFRLWHGVQPDTAPVYASLRTALS